MHVDPRQRNAQSGGHCDPRTYKDHARSFSAFAEIKCRRDRHSSGSRTHTKVDYSQNLRERLRRTATSGLSTHDKTRHTPTKLIKEPTSNIYNCSLSVPPIRLRASQRFGFVSADGLRSGVCPAELPIPGIAAGRRRLMLVAGSRRTSATT